MAKTRDQSGERAFRRGVRELAARHPPLAGIVERHGVPEYWHRAPGFAGLVNIIISQQLSNKAAAAINLKIERFLGEVTPANVLRHDIAALNAAGLTRQKAGYCIGLAEKVLDGSFDFDALACMDDETAREALVALRGVGRWTADIYLMFAMQRNDIWPLGDLALARAMAEVLQLPDAPGPDRQQEIAAQWAPWRGCAARLLWRHYVQTRAS